MAQGSTEEIQASGGGGERDRLDALATYQIVGTAPEPRFDRIARLAATLLRTPIAQVSLVDEHRQWLKARVGLEIAQTPRCISFCSHVIGSDEVFVVPDASTDSRFARNPLVLGPPFVRFYAGAPLLTRDGHRLGSLCVIDRKPRRGLSARRRALLRDLAVLVVEQMELRRSELSRAAMMGFATATELGMLSVDPQGLIKFANPSAATLFGYGPEEMLGKSVDVIVPERMRTAHGAGRARVAEGGESRLAGRTMEVMARRRDGSEFPAEMSLSVWRNEAGTGMGAIIRDISERRERDARLLRLANHDTLTGLCNRRRFETLLGDAFAQGAPATVFLLDIDGFKDVNDSLGHGVGDTLLQAVALRLPGVLEAGATLARFGGDEFAVLAEGDDPLRGRAVAGCILAAFEAPFGVDEHLFQLGVSVGMALGPRHGQDPEELIASADFALYRAKQAGGRCFRIFEPEMRHASVARRATQDELLRALRDGELVLHYQPQVSLADGRLFGVEALIRWQHPERGLLLPMAFLPAVEASSLALPVGSWVLDEACRQMGAWRRAGHSGLRVGVNLFAAQFRSGSLGRQVRAALAAHGVEPSALELEITETIALQNDDHSLAVLRDFREQGVRIAFDDFGTGYASLSTLKRFPLTTLKIDRSFVRDLLTDPQDAAITRAMLSLGREIGLEVIAEGIETGEQEAALRELGCPAGQGYRYGAPMPAEAIARLLEGPRDPVALLPLSRRAGRR